MTSVTHGTEISTHCGHKSLCERGLAGANTEVVLITLRKRTNLAAFKRLHRSKMATSTACFVHRQPAYLGKRDTRRALQSFGRVVTLPHPIPLAIEI